MNNNIYQLNWYIVPQPWDRSGTLVYAGSEDPTQGIFVLDTEFAIDPTNSDLKNKQDLAQYICNLHNRNLKQELNINVSAEIAEELQTEMLN